MHIVTGASSGIGRGVAIALCERDAPVLAVGRDPSRLVALREVAGAGCRTLSLDLATAEGRRGLVDAVDGPVTSLVHAAASEIPLGAWASLDPDELTAHFHVHVAVPIALTGALTAAREVRRVVVIDSFSATTPRVGWSAYAMVKAAAQMSARAAAEELAETSVIRVFPGAVDTPLLRRVLDGSPEVPAVALYRDLESAGRVSDPSDIGREIARILLDVGDDDLAVTEQWHIGHSTSSE